MDAGTYKNHTAHHVHAGAEAAVEKDLEGGDHPLAAGLAIVESVTGRLIVLEAQRTFCHVLSPSCLWNSRW